MHTKLSTFCEKVIEAGWLAAIILVPIFFNIYSARTFEPDKITLMRSIVLVMVLAWLIKVAEVGMGWAESGEGGATKAESPSPGRGGIGRLLEIPLFLPTMLVILAYVISTIFSISPKVALWGSYQRMQGMYTALSYIVIFALVASHLRIRAQIDRLMTTIILTSLPVALYGIIQRYGLDPLPWAGDVQTRVASSLGNSIFVASYLIMAIPPTLARLINSMQAILKEEEPGWGNTVLAAVYIFILAVDLIAVIFSGSRGPLLGLMAGVFFFIFLGLLSVYRQRRPTEILTLGGGLRSLLETVAWLVAGGVLGAVAFSVRGPVTVAGGRLDAGGMVAVGIMLGVLVGMLSIAVRVALGRGWRLWLNWALLALFVAGLLVALNVPNSPFGSVRSLPTVGRLANLFQAGQGTGRVRVLIWGGVLELITPHDPLGIPGEYQDGYNIVRPVIGYGPESMFNAFAKVYPPELAHVEARGSSADRSHNETFDFIATMGLFGFVAYYFLIFGLLYYLLKAVGWIPDAQARRRLLVFLGVGGVLGVSVPPLVAGSLVFSAVGLPAGMLSMIFVYLLWQAFIHKPQPLDGDTPADQGKASPKADTNAQDLVMIGIFAALVAHFIEVHFVFSIAATYVYFWVYAGVVVAWLHRKPEEEPVSVDEREVAAAQGETSPPPAAKAVSRRRRRKQKSASPRGTGAAESPGAGNAPPEDWETWLGVFGLVVAIILIAMIYDFVTTQFDVSRGNFSMIWMFGITWSIGLAVGLGEVAVRGRTWRKPISWGRALLLYGVTSIGYPLFYLMIHRWQLRPRNAVAIDPIQAVIQGANLVTGVFVLFYVFVGLLLLLIAGMLAMPLMRRQPLWRAANWWLYPVLILAVGVVILFKNVDVVRADMLLKQGEQYRNQKQYDNAILLHQRSIEMDADEDFYYLMLALAYQLKGQDNSLPAEERGRAWAEGERIAVEARDINRYNPDNTGNLGRYYLTWAQLTPPDDPQHAVRYQKAQEYFQKAINLAPQNVVYHNLLAQTHYILGQYDQALEILQDSIALDARFDQTQMLLGDTYGALGRPEEAAEAHREAILLNPAAFADQFLDQRIDFYLSFPQMQDIIVAFEEAMLKRPEDVLIPRTLGHIYSRMGDRQNAIAYYTRSLDMGDNNVQTVLAVAGEYLAMEEFQRAAEAYEWAVQLDPNNAQAHSNLGYAYARLGRSDEAMQENEQVLQLNPSDYVSHRNLVLLYRDTGRLDEAIRQGELMLEVTPENEFGPTYLLVGSMHEAAGQTAEAISAYELAVAASPDLAEAYAALGNLCFQAGRLEDALGSFQTLAELTPDDYTVRQQVAVIHRQLGRYDEALAAARLALGVAPEEARGEIEQLVVEIEADREQGQ